MNIPLNEGAWRGCPDRQIMSARARAVRQALGYSTKDVSDSAKIPYQVLTQMGHPRGCLTEETAEKMAKLFIARGTAVTPQYLMEGRAHGISSELVRSVDAIMAIGGIVTDKQALRFVRKAKAAAQ